MVSKGWISPDKIKTIGNGIDTERFARISNNDVLKRTRSVRICAMGRLVVGKGFEDILNAMAICQYRNQIELLFIGGNISQDISPAAQNFKHLTTDLGLSHQVQITGMIDNVEDYLNASDIFIHPSYAEGMPRSLLEAMSVGLPCIATRIRGAREILNSDINGIIYEPHDCKGLANAIDRLFEDAPLRKNWEKTHAKRYWIDSRKRTTSIARSWQSRIYSTQNERAHLSVRFAPNGHSQPSHNVLWSGARNLQHVPSSGQ